ncbi:sensor histidine kinase [Aquimarina aquimarini]|uniref:sensor histidine kinase n=1 Tax=Aquimarina aquimarini TaxID=1191734 RepID=UPI000D561040|nr:histidine kinase [Aquimarina aquimarini]
MTKGFTFLKNNFPEIIFQIIAAVISFIFYSYSQDDSIKIAPYKVSFFLNYAFAAMIINYVLLPKIYSKKKFFLFFIAMSLIVSIVIMVDEFILEPIYFPYTRGTYFPGVLFTLIETLPIIGFFVGCKFAWDFNSKQREIEKLKNLVQESELQFLKSQINPHFLFNNLNNLYAHAIEESPKTPSIILELSSVLRYMLYDCKGNFVSLIKEIDHLQNYTALHELQIGHRGDIRFNTEIISPDYVIAPLILIVFIENAFKHSTASQSENIIIDIETKVTETGLLTFCCKNSFLPNTNTSMLSHGIGLVNVKKRLQLLYPNTHELQITDINNLFEVTLTVQLKSIK